MTMSQERYSGAMDDFTAASERHAEQQTEGSLAAKRAAGERMDRLWSIADREWYASLGPVSLTRDGDGIRYFQSSPQGGARSGFVGPADSRYAALAATMVADEEADHSAVVAACALLGIPLSTASLDWYGAAARVQITGQRLVIVEEGVARFAR